MSRQALFLVLNILLFQVGWLVCILAGTDWALIYTFAALVVHFSVSSQRRADVVSVLLCVLIGLIHDLVLIHTQMIQFTESSDWPPLWLVCLWVLMGITLHHSLGWLYARPLWAALLGAVSGPLSYLAGVQLSPAQWSSPLTEVIPIMVALWLFVLPLHRFLSMRIKPYVSH